MCVAKRWHGAHCSSRQDAPLPDTNTSAFPLSSPASCLPHSWRRSSCCCYVDGIHRRSRNHPLCRYARSGQADAKPCAMCLRARCSTRHLSRRELLGDRAWPRRGRDGAAGFLAAAVDGGDCFSPLRRTTFEARMGRDDARVDQRGGRACAETCGRRWRTHFGVRFRAMARCRHRLCVGDHGRYAVSYQKTSLATADLRSASALQNAGAALVALVLTVLLGLLR